jgi:hypothetical protein
MEIHITKITLKHHLITLTVIALSIITLYFTSNPGISGIVYFLMPLIHFPVGLYETHQMKKSITPSQEMS